MIFPAVAMFSFFSWEGMGAPLANHLWQSTVFAGVVWLLTLLLGRNRAQTRYCLWLVASAKFLLPFSLLVGLGIHLALTRTPAATQPKLFIAMETLGQPFSTTNLPPIPARAAPSVFEVALRSLPTFVPMVWFAGCVAVLLMWYLRWRRLQMASRAGLLAKAGREFEALRRVEQSGRRNGQLDVILSESALEPGILGIFRPVLLLPAGISERLNDDQLDAILMHELCHLRRHDNLAAALHMLVEALFWFHPLVWWMGARLVDERERACDEDVLWLGTDPHVYAEGILKVCKFYLESPLFCAAGVTGSNLKKRIEAIMVNRKARSLDFGRKLLLSAAGFLVVLVPIAFGFIKPAKSQAQSQAQDTPPPVPAFESASIKLNNGEPMAGFEIVGKPFNAIVWQRDRLMATNLTLHALVRVAYGVQDDQIVGGPDWVNTEGYDVDAKMGKSVVDEIQKWGRRYGVSGRTLMFQKLLSDRFRLSFHRETRDLPVYALVVAANGPKVQPAKPGDTYVNGFKNPDGSAVGAGIWETASCKIVGQGVPIGALVAVLSGHLSRTVLDETELKGAYDFTLDCFAPMRTPENSSSLLEAVPEHAEALTKMHAIETASLLQAVLEQLGLELKPQTAPVEVLVIDHAEQATGSEEMGTLRPAHGYAVLQTQNASINTFPFQTVTFKANKTGAPTSAIGFEPDRFMATNVPLHALIAAAYGIEGSEILGGPDWVRSENYDIEAKLDAPVIDELSKLGPDQRLLEQKRILQALLADRFRLALHRETREPPAYVLAIAKDGLKLQQAKPGDTYPDGLKDPQGRPLGAGALLQPGPCKVVGQGVHMPDLARTLSMNYLDGRTVVDQTGLGGVYDFTLDCHTALMERGESALAVLPEQLGLELKPLANLVIDSAEKASEN